MRHIAAAATWLTLALSPRPAHADDVDLIPPAVVDPQAGATPPAPATEKPPASMLRAKAFVEDAFSVWSAARYVPVPYPGSNLLDWQNRTSFDALLQWRPSPSLTLALSDRLNLFEQDGQAVVSANTVRNDLREGSVTWEASPGSYLEAGRINVRNGAALGFNPTDFFKTRTLVGQASLDPSVIRQNRLGTLMAGAQAIWDKGSASVQYAPKVARPSPVVEEHPVGIDPRFDATNGASRVLCTLTFEALDLSPQLLGYFELHRSKLGANVTRAIGDAVVAYAEWAGGPEQNLVSRAVAFGKETGTLPPGAPIVPPAPANVAFRNDVATGFSWTLAAAATVNVEYHFHDAGFARRDWERWFALGSAPGAPPGVPGTLWFVRGYANDQQEPVSQHQAFVRVSWPRVLLTDLELDAFAFVDLLDGSVLTQASAIYFLSDHWTASAYASANFGAGETERGSVPQRGNLILQLTWFP